MKIEAFSKRHSGRSLVRSTLSLERICRTLMPRFQDTRCGRGTVRAPREDAPQCRFWEEVARRLDSAYFPRLFMATLKPFAALRPRPDLASRICELPYDVMSSEEARQIAEGNRLSFLHVSKPEIDLPPGTDPYSPAVYARGKENFERLIAQGALRQDAKPAFYLYRQVMGKHTQIGLVAVARDNRTKGGGEQQKIICTSP